MTELLYDATHKRLVYLKKGIASSDFWDRYWEKAQIASSFAHPSKQRFLLWMTQKYVNPDAKILERRMRDGGNGLRAGKSRV